MNRSTSKALNKATLDQLDHGVDLLVSIRNLPRGKWSDGIAEQIREAIRSGVLRSGERLPSSRALAEDLGVSRGVVLGVFDQLKAEGYLLAKRGSGTVVADIGIIARTAPLLVVQKHREHTNPGVPDSALFPRKEWLRSYRLALTNLQDVDFRYGDPQGFLPLRTELAGYLGRVRGVSASPDQILIVNGFAQGLAILARMLLGAGIDAVAVEDPGSAGTRTQLQDWGLATPAVDVDEEGVKVESLRSMAANAVLVTPAHQYPTGVVLSAERRRELLQWVGEAPNRFILEDDYDAEYRYEGAPIGSLQAANPQRVITGSSVSKTLAPALRLGWLVLPTELVESAVTVKAAFDLGTSVPCQAAFAEFLRSGSFDRHLRRTRQKYALRRRLLASELQRALPGCTFSGLDAGLNICIRFGSTTDDNVIARKLKHQGVKCEALSTYQQGQPALSGLIIDISTTQPVDLIGDVIAEDPQRSA